MNKEIKIPEKKQSVRPADPKITPLIQPTEAPKNPEEQEEVFQPYPDDVLFKCSPRNVNPEPKGTPIPDPTGKFIIHDGGGQVVALVANQGIANLFCAALHVYFQAAKKHAEDEANNAKVPGEPMPPAVAEALNKRKK